MITSKVGWRNIWRLPHSWRSQYRW